MGDIFCIQRSSISMRNLYILLPTSLFSFRLCRTCAMMSSADPVTAGNRPLTSRAFSIKAWSSRSWMDRSILSTVPWYVDKKFELKESRILDPFDFKYQEATLMKKLKYSSYIAASRSFITVFVYRSSQFVQMEILSDRFATYVESCSAMVE